MTESWEYISIRWIGSTKKVVDEQQWQNVFRIWRSPTEFDERVEFAYGDDESKAQILEVLNELGEEGWELVTETVLGSAVVAGLYGWSNAGTPIDMRWVLKRPKKTS